MCRNGRTGTVGGAKQNCGSANTIGSELGWRIAHEDIIGAGAILWSLFAGSYRVDLPFTDTAWLAYNAFSATRGRLGAALRLGQGGINLIENGFEDDIDFCAALDTTPIIVRVEKHPLVARKFQAV